MGKMQRGDIGAECGKNIKLHPGIGHVILTAHDVRDGHVNIIDHRGECVEKTAIGADQYRVADRRQFDAARAQHTIIPFA